MSTTHHLKRFLGSKLKPGNGPTTFSLLSSSSASSLTTSSPLLQQEPLPQYHLHTIPSDPYIYTNILISYSKQCLQDLAHYPFDEKPDRAQTSQSCRTLHARTLRLGFHLSIKLGHALIDLYAKSGDLGYAQKAFDHLEERNGTVCNSILSGHSRWGSPIEVVCAFRSIRCSGDWPDQFGFAMVLSGSARLVSLDFGRQVHCDVIKTGFDSNSFCEASLIDMYFKCGHVFDARRVFAGISNPDTISWTNMIAGYTRLGMFDEALELFSIMEETGGKPDQVTYGTVISACISLKRLEDAKTFFLKMPSPNTVAWNAIISGHAQNGLDADALCFYKEMKSRGLRPTRSTLGSLLSAVANLAAIDEGRQVHSEAIRLGLDSNVFVGSSLINMYAKCSEIRDASKVFYFCCERNIVTWNAMLGCLVQNEQPEYAIELFLEMKRLGLEMDEFTYVSVFGACASLESLDLGRQLHSVIIRINYDSSLFVGNAVLDMYAKSGELNDAKAQLELIPNRDCVTWNAIIVGLVHNEDELEALNMLKKMRLEATDPDEISFASLVSACSNIHAIELGKQIHCLALKFDLSSNHFVGSSLIDLYAKFGDMEAAKKVFLKMPERGVVPRNALIAGHVQNDSEVDAFRLFRQMQADGICPSNFTFASILPACTGHLGFVIGKQVHCYTVKSCLLYADAFLMVSLLGMYMKSEMLEDANKLFVEMPENKGLVLWTAFISGHAQIGCSNEALLLFWKMRSCNLHPDEATFASVLKACADLAALSDGKEIHSLITKAGFSSYEAASTALMDMYSKCGDISCSFEVFKGLKNKENVISWNSMISGFAQNGYAEEALSTFQKMQESPVKPDDITFLGVLTACTHAGLVLEGHHFFDSMTREYRITPRVDHYACLIDLLGRVGYLKEAQKLIDGLPFEPDSVIWSTFLAACRMHRDEIRGKLAAAKLIELEPDNSSHYVLLSNLYAASGNWVEAKIVREAMRERGVKKSPGRSWITVENKTSSFIAGDKFHDDANDIYEVLKDLTGTMKKCGHIVEHDLVLLDELVLDL
ncbi:pentatricopeptide repeat-containing protein At3g09040, mitochondrial [Typha angustifolia]|uniref:pentatricopeptide repeat-containing protein At3g09040, mitochondrial n=1 Tax=Typha angustifolia TaxID=59011 RepID=UPI003C2CF210